MAETRQRSNGNLSSPNAVWSKLHRLRSFKKSIGRNAVCSGAVTDTNQRQVALSVLESLREDLIYAHLNNGSRILDVADLRQYIYEEMGRIRTNGLAMDGLCGNDNGHGQDIGKSNGHNGKSQPQGKVWRERPAGQF